MPELSHHVEEGPYYKTGSPQRTNVTEGGAAGEKLLLEGRVLDREGRPVAGAWVDFWQADGKGEYDNAGYRLRGHQYTDEQGNYRLETVRPAFYAGRTPHIHVKVQANEKSPVLTSQLYFSGEKRNEKDPLFDAGTVMQIEEGPGGKRARFDFVVETETE